MASSSSLLPTSGSPASETSPSVGVSSPATMFRSVDLPQPDGPITATNSAGVIEKSTPRSARTGAPSDSNVLRNPCVSTTNPPAMATSLICQSSFHVVEHVDAVRPHRRVPTFDRRLIERHALDLGVQRRVGALVDHDPSRRTGEILEPLR